jgi:hypothetical protein
MNAPWEIAPELQKLPPAEALSHALFLSLFGSESDQELNKNRARIALNVPVCGRLSSL